MFWHCLRVNVFHSFRMFSILLSRFIVQLSIVTSHDKQINRVRRKKIHQNRFDLIEWVAITVIVQSFENQRHHQIRWFITFRLFDWIKRKPKKKNWFFLVCQWSWFVGIFWRLPLTKTHFIRFLSFVYRSIVLTWFAWMYNTNKITMFFIWMIGFFPKNNDDGRPKKKKKKMKMEMNEKENLDLCVCVCVGSTRCGLFLSCLL